MIYTITPNPALDLGGVVERIVPNEKAYVHDETRFPGGNAINAARIIRQLGEPVIASGFLGGGTGDEVETRLRNEGVQCQFVRIQGNTRVSVTVSDRKSHLQTRLSFAGPQIQPHEIKKLMDYVSKINQPALIVVGGSLPPGFSSSHLKELIQVAQHRCVPCIVDVPGKVLRDVISSKPFLVKPNLVEFQDLIGKKVSSIQGVLKEARNITQSASCVCVSSVKNGALLVTPRRAWFGEPPEMKVKSTVGAGDSMVGAMTAQIWKLVSKLDHSYEIDKIFENGDDLLKLGLAAAAATLSMPGTHLGEAKEIFHFYSRVKVKEIT